VPETSTRKGGVRPFVRFVIGSMVVTGPASPRRRPAALSRESEDRGAPIARRSSAAVAQPASRRPP
jgi:hypothetical protein